MTDLTKQWKARELIEGFYYVKCPWSDEIEVRYVHNGTDEYERIVAPVLSYKELQELKEYEKTIKSYNGMPIDYTIACETVNKLLDEKDKLKSERDKLAYDLGVADTKNSKLLRLLKECKEHLCHHYCQITVGKLEKKINEVLR